MTPRGTAVEPDLYQSNALLTALAFFSLAPAFWGWCYAFGAVFLGEERDVEGPVSVVGVSVLGGQVLERDQAVLEEVATFLNLLAAVNLSLFLLNLLPILPLDGGHVLPAAWEAKGANL